MTRYPRVAWVSTGLFLPLHDKVLGTSCFSRPRVAFRACARADSRSVSCCLHRTARPLPFRFDEQLHMIWTWTEAPRLVVVASCARSNYWYVSHVARCCPFQDHPSTRSCRSLRRRLSVPETFCRDTPVRIGSNTCASCKTNDCCNSDESRPHPGICGLRWESIRTSLSSQPSACLRSIGAVVRTLTPIEPSLLARLFCLRRSTVVCSLTVRSAPASPADDPTRLACFSRSRPRCVPAAPRVSLQLRYTRALQSHSHRFRTEALL